MSRVAKAPVEIPSNVQFSFSNHVAEVNGPLGTLKQNINSLVELVVSEKEISFKPKVKNTKSWAQAGTARALINNMVTGVTSGFSKELQLVGVGYRAQAKGQVVNLNLGFSHPIDYNLPEEIKAETPNNTTIVLKSIDKQKLGQVAAEIRSYREPEPYKGKGIRYANEMIARKEAKKK